MTEVKGLHEALEWLEVTAPRLSKQLAGDLVYDVATKIADRAKVMMPVRTGAMRASTKSKRDGFKNNTALASVRCGRFYWYILENGDGPDGVEYAMFTKSREAVFVGLASDDFPKFNKRLAASFR